MLDFLAPLGLRLPITVEDVKHAYRAKVKSAHPDVGGDAKRFTELQRAYEKAHEYARTHSLGWIGHAVELYVAERRLIDRVKQLGGSIGTEVSDWLKQEVGEDFVNIFERVVRIHLQGRHVDDTALELVLEDREAVRSVREFAISHCRVTFHGLQRLSSGLPKLELLYLTGTDLTWWQRRKLRWLFPGLDIVVLPDQATEALTG